MTNQERAAKNQQDQEKKRRGTVTESNFEDLPGRLKATVMIIIGPSELVEESLACQP
jgi:hypothetical protein